MSKKTIQYYEGDATQPVGPGTKVVAHICNNVGAWGAGFVLAVSKRWEAPERLYYTWKTFGDTWNYGQHKPFRLGETQFVCADLPMDIYVANMIAQNNKRWSASRGMPPFPGYTPFRPRALRKCLRQVREFAVANFATVHMPRIGTGIGGGDWTEISGIIQRELCDHGVEVYVYDLPK